MVENDSSSRRIMTEDAQAYADESGLFFLETSAKTAFNVDALFEEIAKRLPKVEVPNQNPGLPLEQVPVSSRQSGTCC